jgi:hypothetical protein
MYFNAERAGVDMTIRGAVSGRMKRSQAWRVESRASGQATVWGSLLTGLSEVRGPLRRRLSAVRPGGSRDDVDNGVA